MLQHTGATRSQLIHWTSLGLITGGVREARGTSHHRVFNVCDLVDVVVELLRKAIEWRRLLDAGDAPNQADIARREGLTRARVTQVLGLLWLASEIQEHILSMPETVSRSTVTERALRPIAQIEDKRQQMAEFQQLLEA